MPHWTKVNTPEERLEYYRLLQSSSDAYNETTMDGINNLFDVRKGHAYIYQDPNPDGYQILILITPSPSNDGTWKIVNTVPIGECDPVDAAKIALRQIRKIFDELGIPDTYCRVLHDYKNAQVNEFYQQVRNLTWELTEVETRPDHIAYTIRFSRDPARKNEDELFIGSGL